MPWPGNGPSDKPIPVHFGPTHIGPSPAESTTTMPLSSKHMAELERELGRDIFKAIDTYRNRLIIEGEPDPEEGFISSMSVLIQTIAAGGIALDVPESIIHEMINMAYTQVAKEAPAIRERIVRSHTSTKSHD
jgi:hypothetical protein